MCVEIFHFASFSYAIYVILRIRFHSDNVAYAVYICIVYRIVMCSERDIYYCCCCCCFLGGGGPSNRVDGVA